MKKFAILAVILACGLVAGCEQEKDTGIPVLQNVIVGTYASVTSGQEINEFKLGDNIYFSFTVYDDNMDIEKMTLTQKSDNKTIGPDDISLPEQESKNQLYIGNIQAIYDGDWIVEAYCVDKNGNKSNTVSKNIVVTTDGVPVWTIKYDLNGGIGETPVDNRKYTRYMSAIFAGSEKFSKPGYDFLYWSRNRNGLDSKGLPGEGFGYDTAGERTFYAIWNNPLTNIQHTRTTSGYTHSYKILWDEPQVNIFDHILLDIYVGSSYTPNREYLSGIIIEKGIKEYNFDYSVNSLYPYLYIGLTVIDNNDFPTKRQVFYINNYDNFSTIYD
jgi:hypothetical protein